MTGSRQSKTQDRLRFFDEAQTWPRSVGIGMLLKALGSLESAVDALAGEAEELLKSLGSLGLRHGDLGRLHLDAHLVILGVGLGTLVLGVRAAALASTVIEDSDDRGLGGLVHAGAGRQALEERSHGRSSSAGLDDLATAKVHGLSNREERSVSTSYCHANLYSNHLELFLTSAVYGINTVKCAHHGRRVSRSRGDECGQSKNLGGHQQLTMTFVLLSRYYPAETCNV
jgi:hypothetical protein